MSSSSSVFHPRRARSAATSSAPGHRSDAARCGHPALAATASADLSTVSASTASERTRRLLSRDHGWSGSSTATPPGTSPTPTARRIGPGGWYARAPPTPSSGAGGAGGGGGRGGEGGGTGGD